MRIVFVNRFYWPAEPATAQLLGDLAEALASRGYDVCALTALTSTAVSRLEARNGVAIVRVGPPLPSTESLVARAWHFVRFHAAVLWRLPRMIRRHDVVVSLTDPPLLGVTAVLAARCRGARVVHWIQDIYPEILPALARGALPKLLAAALRPLRNAAWYSANACVTLGDDMAELVRENDVSSSRVHVIENWSPKGIDTVRETEVAALRAEWQIRDRFVIGYSGNLGRVHDLDSVIEVAERLRDDEKFAFLFIGRGAAFSQLAVEAKRRELHNVKFLPARPRSELAASLRVPDLHIVSLRAGCEALVFPSKLYGIVAAGRPILFLGPPESEIGRQISAGGFGATCRPNDVAGIARQIRTWEQNREQLALASAAALQFSAARGGHDRAATQWEQLLRPTLTRSADVAETSLGSCAS